MKKPRRTWRQALGTAADRDAAEGTSAHSNEVIFGMIADMLRAKGTPAQQAQARFAKASPQFAVFMRRKAKPAALLFTSAKLPRGGRP